MVYVEAYAKWMNDRVPAKRDQLLDLLRAHASDWARFGVRAFALFGSVARDEARPDSDVDVLVDFDGPATFDRYMGLRFYLEDLLGRRIDLVTRRGLREELRPAVESEAIRVA